MSELHQWAVTSKGEKHEKNPLSCPSWRCAWLPDVPCTGEMGIDSTVGIWRGLWARRDTPPEAIAAMDEAIVEAMNSRKWSKFLVVGSYELRPGYCNTADFERFIENEYGRYAVFYHRQKMLTRIYGEED